MKKFLYLFVLLCFWAFFACSSKNLPKWARGHYRSEVIGTIDGKELELYITEKEIKISFGDGSYRTYNIKEKGLGFDCSKDFIKVDNLLDGNFLNIYKEGDRTVKVTRFYYGNEVEFYKL